MRIGVDVGSVRVGVAASDPHATHGVPGEGGPARRDDSDLDELAALIAEREAVEVVVGLPRSLSGREGPAVVAARSYAAALSERIAPVPVTFVDERLTTVVADRSRCGRRAHVRQCASGAPRSMRRRRRAFFSRTSIVRNAHRGRSTEGRA